MPHVIIKMYPGRTNGQKEELAKKIEKEMVEIFGCSEKVVSVSFEEIEQDEWKDKVYIPDIKNKAETVWKKPDYKV